MMKFYFSSLLFFCFVNFSNAQIIDFQDNNFKDALVNERSVNFGDPFQFFDADTNDDGEIDISEAEAVTGITVDFENITSLVDIEFFVNISSLNVIGNPIASVELSNLPSQLEILRVGSPELENLDLSGNAGLKQLSISNTNLTDFDFDSLFNLTFLGLERNSELRSLDLTNNTSIDILILERNEKISALDLSPLKNAERIRVFFCDLENIILPNSANLRILDLRGNKLESVDLNPYLNLDELRLSNNIFSDIDVTSNVNLTFLSYTKNNISEPINTLNNTKLKELYCNGLNFDSLNVTHLGNLTRLSCASNNLEELDVTQNLELTDLIIFDNYFTQIDISNNLKLVTVSLGTNKFKSLDFSGFTELRSVFCQDNYFLETLNIKNGNNSNFLNYNSRNCPNLSVVCVDDKDYADQRFIQKDPQTLFIEDCNITSSDLNIIGGTVWFDDNNNCNNSFTLPNIRVNYEKDNEEISAFTNNSGQFNFTTDEGNSNVMLSNIPEYFTATPNLREIEFSDLGMTEIVDFCVSSTETVDDLAIQIVPTTATRPGFETTYAITYTNQGTTVVGGNIDFEFDQNKQEYLNSSKTPITISTGRIQYDFIELTPLMSHTIFVTMKNFPPPTLNGGELINCSVEIKSGETDGTPANNLYNLSDLVVNSFDPNDITVAQGSMITLDQTNNYLDYVIRFQNTGSASAINVAITHSLNFNLDGATFIPISSSHNYEAKILNSKFIEFVFDDINLPAESTDPDSSQGFIAFKIIPKTDVIDVGNIIYAQADIYFDFNEAITTNQVSTEVVTTLSNDEFLSDVNFKVFPNPTDNFITIESDKQFENLALNDLNGRLLLEMNENSNRKEISVQNINKGIYLLTVKFDNVTKTVKIVRK